MKEKIISIIIFILRKMAALLMIFVVMTVAVQLVCRNFLNIPTPWTEDVSKCFLVWMTFLGSPVVLHRGEHLMVDLIYAILNRRTRVFVNIIMYIIVIAFCAICFKLGMDLCTNRIILKSTTAAAGIPRVYIFSALPVGAVFMLLISINNLYDNILILLGKKADITKIFVADETKTLRELGGTRS